MGGASMVASRDDHASSASPPNIFFKITNIFVLFKFLLVKWEIVAVLTLSWPPLFILII